MGFAGKCVLVIRFLKFFIFCDNGAGIGIAEEELLRFWGRVWGYDVLFFCFQIVSIFW